MSVPESSGTYDMDYIDRNDSNDQLSIELLLRCTFITVTKVGTKNILLDLKW